MKDTDDVLDIGDSLKKEKIFKENQEKVKALKEQYEKEQKSTSPVIFPIKGNLFFFLFIILLITIGIRLYSASMPLTQEWAEQVVTENLKIKVSNAVYETYPTLSDAKKQEIIQAGVEEALAAAQNQDAIKILAATYKQSYKDPEGNSYLYEIDPYFFYEIAENKDATLSVHAHNLLSFVERAFYNLVTVFLPSISFTQAIFYLPLLFTILCAGIVFFMGKEIWNETAGFVAAIFFAVHPILLEFSMLGFVDTNMLNMFFILLTGLLFLYIVRILRMKEKTKKEYALIAVLPVAVLFCIFLFRYAWSAWYVSIGLIIAPAMVMALLLFKDIVKNWKSQTAKTKKIIILATIVVLVCIGAMILYGLGHEEGYTQTRIEQKIFTPTVKKYLHVDYEDPYGQWPDAFSLIKELQQTELNVFIDYLGGNIALLFSLPILLYLFYKGIKEINGSYVYLVIAYVFFIILSFRAIRLLPYLIPYFAVTIGISIAIAGSWVLQKVQGILMKEKKAMQCLFIVLVYCILLFLIAYPLFEKIEQTSKIMPIMDDAIYNSAIYIQQNSQENALVSAWWDRGTFYKALTEREVHIHSQPHMPRTYWMSTFYLAEDEVQAKNIISVIDCSREQPLYDVLSQYLTQTEAINTMKDTFLYEEESERNEYLNETLSLLSDNQKEEVYERVTEMVSCSEPETYIVVIDDLMPRFSAVEYFAAWDFTAQQPDPQYPYVEINEYGCGKYAEGVRCSIAGTNVFVNFTSLEVTGAVVDDVYLVSNETVQYKNWTRAETKNPNALIVYNRAGYWKAVYLPKQIADSMYVRLMLLDGYNLASFEKVFDEVHVETAWVKVYKVDWSNERG